MKIFYNIGILIYRALAYIVSPFSQKVRLWFRGQNKWYQGLKPKVEAGEKYIWIHCASLGEFEQGRPVIEELRKRSPQYKIVLTFFSPSGYEVRKNYEHADIICYLPADTPVNAAKFIRLINPVLAIFVKYEFWNNYISELSRRQIKLYLISGFFRKDQPFFKWYGSFFRSILQRFSWIFVQDQGSQDLLKGIGLINCSLAGDTRFDRVMQLTDNVKVIHALEKFRGKEKLFLAGSSWKQDEEIIAGYINKYPERMKWVFAPHEPADGNIERLEKLLRVKCTRFSQFHDESCDARVMIIDNVGMLSAAYRYAYVAAVGGGFGKGIHNILEPACWGIPVLFGPNHSKFREADDLIGCGGGKSFKDYNDFEKSVGSWLDDEELYKKAALSAGKYVKENTGATHKIMQNILQKDINKLYS
jgi:3-deoxy-D-manno-octulosonic-acid transferase